MIQLRRKRLNVDPDPDIEVAGPSSLAAVALAGQSHPPGLRSLVGVPCKHKQKQKQKRRTPPPDLAERQSRMFPHTGTAWG